MFSCPFPAIIKTSSDLLFKIAFFIANFLDGISIILDGKIDFLILALIFSGFSLLGLSSVR